MFGEDFVEGFFGGDARVAEIFQGGEDVFSDRTGGSGNRGDGSAGGQRFELVFQLEGDTLGSFFADAGDAGEGGVVGGADGGDEAFGLESAEDGEGEAGADAADGEQFFEEAFFVERGESVEGKLVFADVGVDVEGGFVAEVGEGGEGGDGDGGFVTDSGAVEDDAAGGFFEDGAAEAGDHGAIVDGRGKGVMGRVMRGRWRGAATPRAAAAAYENR